MKKEIKVKPVLVNEGRKVYLDKTEPKVNPGTLDPKGKKETPVKRENKDLKENLEKTEPKVIKATKAKKVIPVLAKEDQKVNQEPKASQGKLDQKEKKEILVEPENKDRKVNREKMEPRVTKVVKAIRETRATVV